MNFPPKSRKNDIVVTSYFSHHNDHMGKHNSATVLYGKYRVQYSFCAKYTCLGVKNVDEDPLEIQKGRFLKNPVEFDIFPVYRDGIKFSGISRKIR